MMYCPACGMEGSRHAIYCKECGAKLIEKQPNTCSNPECEHYQRTLEEDCKYCEQCGSPTTYWVEVKKNL